MCVVSDRSRLVADPEHIRVRVAQQKPPKRFRGVGNHPLVDLRGAGPKQRHSDGVLVHVEHDVCNVRRGRSFRVSAPRARSRG